METRTRNRVIAFRVTPAERRKIEAKVRQSGLSQQEYLLHAALETPILVVEDLKPLLSELRAWGRNLNQLTVLAHQGHIRSADLREATGRAGQGLRGGQRTPDRGRAGGNPWRRAVSSVRRSRPPAPWAASCGTWPRSRKPWTQTAPAISPGSTAWRLWPIRASWLQRTCTARASGTWFYHYTQSFSPQERVTPAEAHQIAQELAERFFPGCEVLVATHIDRAHLHSHLVVNSVKPDTGKKLHFTPRTLERMRLVSDQICREHGLTILKPYRQKKQVKGLRPGEYRSAMRGQSWKFQLIAVIEERPWSAPAAGRNSWTSCGAGATMPGGRKAENILPTSPSWECGAGTISSTRKNSGRRR